MSGLDDEEKGELEGDEDVESVDEETSESEEEFSDDLDDDASDEFTDETFDSDDEDLKVVDEVLSHKDQNARALAIRRAIEERLEAKRLSRDLDYLDLDLEIDD